MENYQIIPKRRDNYENSTEQKIRFAVVSIDKKILWLFILNGWIFT